MLVAQTHANVKIGAAYTGLLTGFTGKTHQDVEDLAIMRAMPGMTVIAPGDAAECVAAVRWATATPGPVYLRLARDAGPDLFDGSYRFEPGRVIRLRDGSDVLIVSTGMQSARSLAAATILEASGISAGVLHVPSLKPVDAEAIVEAARPVGLVVTTEEHTIHGGLGGLVAEILGERLPRRIVRIGIADTWGESAPNAFLLERHGLSAERVAERIAREIPPTNEPPGSDRGDRMTAFQLKNPNDIGVAFLGVGRIGTTHLLTLAGIPNARLVVVADLDPAEAERGREVGRAERATTDALDAINDPAVEAVVIVTPTSTHAALIEAALRAGKAIWSEKPIALDLAETNRVVALWRETGLPVQMGFMRRFDPGYVKAKALIDAGELGRIEQFRAYSRDTYLPPAKFIRGQRRLVPRHERPRLRPRPLPRRRGRGGLGLGEQRHRQAVRGGRRRRHGGHDAPLPERRARRRRDVPPLRVGLRHPDRGGRRARQGRRGGAAQDGRDVLAAVRL